MMNETALRQQLEKHYELVGFFDLAELAQSHGQIYGLLKSVWQAEYHPRQRLVFYTAHEPSQKLLNHLQHGLARVDISNWFVLICCPNDLTNALAQANRAFGHDHTAVTWQYSSIAATAVLDDSKIYDHSVTCPMPFIHISEGPDQSVQPCCRYRGIVGNVADSSYQEIFSGQAMTTIRQHMRDGHKHPACSTCWRTEQQGTTSQRQLYLLKYQDQMNQHWLDDIKIRVLSTCPSTACNFKCRICNSDASSAWATEDLKFTKDAQLRKAVEISIDSNKWIGAEKFMAKLDSVIDHLEQLHVMGGDPLYLKDFDQILTSLVEKKINQRLSMCINTNGSVYDQKIIDLLKQFKYTEILLSIDDIGHRFELQRGGSWHTVEHNVKLYAGNLASNFSVKLAVTVNIQNVLYLDQLVEFAQGLDLDIVWTYLDSPDHYSIDHMTAAANHLVWHKYHDSDCDELRAIAHRVQLNSGSDGRKFLARTHELDQRRNQKFETSHPEIYQAMSVFSV